MRRRKWEIGVATEVLGVRVGVSVQGVRAGLWTGSGVEWTLDGLGYWTTLDIGRLRILDRFRGEAILDIGVTWILDGYWN